MQFAYFASCMARRNGRTSSLALELLRPQAPQQRVTGSNPFKRKKRPGCLFPRAILNRISQCISHCT
jgi:hypothetical protein